MITDAQKKEVIAAIEQLQDEKLLAQITEVLSRSGWKRQTKRVREPGFAKGMVTYVATDFDEKEVIAAIEQLDEVALQKIAQTITEVSASRPRALLGFARGQGLWMADDFDEPLEDFADYM